LEGRQLRFAGWVCLVLALGCLIAAPVLGVLAIQQATEISAYHHARACAPSAGPGAGCLQIVHGSVTAVTEFPGSGRISADYALDVKTASTTLRLTFSSDSPMLGYAVDGDPAAVTIWRRVPVSVVTDGRSAVTTSVPETAFARDLGDSAKTAGIGVFFVLGALAIRRNGKVGAVHPVTSPAVGAMLCALLFGGAVLAIGGFALGGRPSRLGPDLTASGSGLVLVIGLSVWLGISAKRRLARQVGSQGHAHNTADSRALHAPLMPRIPVPRQARTPLRLRLHPASLARVMGNLAAVWLTPALIVAVLFGVFFTSHDGPAARAYRLAPACVGETNLATCAGDFTAVVNGVRTPANDVNGADVSYVTGDGVINTWARFGGDSRTVTRVAAAEQDARTLVTIRVWRGSILGAELGSSWQWTWGNPPGNTVPTVFLAVSFGLLLLVVRIYVHRRTRSGSRRQRVLIDDAGQAATAAGSIVLLAYGYWPGVALAVAVLAWLGLSARQSAHRRRVPAAAGLTHLGSQV
jgi:hypothetical protein